MAAGSFGPSRCYASMGDKVERTRTNPKPPPEDKEWNEPLPPMADENPKPRASRPYFTVSTWYGRIWMLMRIPFVYVIRGRFEI